MTERQVEYQEYLQSQYWKEVSEMVKERAGYRCQVCNSGRRLEAHHRTYDHLKDEKNHLGDLTCLCHKCHSLFHGITTKKRSKKAPKDAKTKKEERRARRRARFFRRAARKLKINAESLAAMGQQAVHNMLVEHWKERTRIRKERKEAKMARALAAAGL